MVNWEIVIIGIVSGSLGALITTFFGPFLNHKFNIKYMKKEIAFNKKLNFFEQIGELSWQNHLSLTTIESILEKRPLTEIEKSTIKAQLIEAVRKIAQSLGKGGMYSQPPLKRNLGRYITSIERYLNNPSFGEKNETEKLRKTQKEYMKIINQEIKKDIGKIK